MCYSPSCLPCQSLPSHVPSPACPTCQLNQAGEKWWPWLGPGLLHLKAAISQEAKCVPEGQESLSNRASLNGLRDTWEAGRHAESWQHCWPQESSSTRINPDSSLSEGDEGGQPAASFLKWLQASALLEMEGEAFDEFAFEGWSGEMKAFVMVSHPQLP